MKSGWKNTEVTCDSVTLTCQNLCQTTIVYFNPFSNPTFMGSDSDGIQNHRLQVSPGRLLCWGRGPEKRFTTLKRAAIEATTRATIICGLPLPRYRSGLHAAGCDACHQQRGRRLRGHHLVTAAGTRERRLGWPLSPSICLAALGQQRTWQQSGAVPESLYGDDDHAHSGHLWWRHGCCPL